MKGHVMSAEVGVLVSVIEMAEGVFLEERAVQCDPCRIDGVPGVVPCIASFDKFIFDSPRPMTPLLVVAKEIKRVGDVAVVIDPLPLRGFCLETSALTFLYRKEKIDSLPPPIKIWEEKSPRHIPSLKVSGADKYRVPTPRRFNRNK